MPGGVEKVPGGGGEKERRKSDFLARYEVYIVFIEPISYKRKWGSRAVDGIRFLESNSPSILGTLT